MPIYPKIIVKGVVIVSEIIYYLKELIEYQFFETHSLNFFFHQGKKKIIQDLKVQNV